MDDYMDKQKAADLLDNLIGMVEDNHGNDYNAALKMGIEALKAYTQPEQHWIPCNERLPEKGQWCLVSDKGHIAIDTFIGHGNPYNWHWYVRDYEAWMPLPEPYKGSEQDG